MPKTTIDEQVFLDAALHEFGSKSYEVASVNTIIEQAGISKGSFYYRFKNKFELYFHLLKTGFENKWEFIEKKLIGVDCAKANLFQLLQVQAKAGIEFAEKNREYYQLGRMFAKEKGTDIYTRVLAELKPSKNDELVSLIHEKYAKGYFRQELSEEFIVKIISHLLLSFDELFLVEDASTAAEAYGKLEEFLGFMKFGLVGKE